MECVANRYELWQVTNCYVLHFAQYQHARKALPDHGLLHLAALFTSKVLGRSDFEFIIRRKCFRLQQWWWGERATLVPMGGEGGGPRPRARAGQAPGYT